MHEQHYCYLCNQLMKNTWVCNSCIEKGRKRQFDVLEAFLRHDRYLASRFAPTDPRPAYALAIYHNCVCELPLQYQVEEDL